MRTNFYFCCLICLLVAACQSSASKAPSGPPPPKGFITDMVVQDSLFKLINRVMGHTMDSSLRSDSLEILFLPVTASCPACLKKTIDSIVKFSHRLDDHHYIVVTGGGKRIIKGYFAQQGYDLPVGPQIVYDTVGLARKLTSTNPNIYFSAQRKVYRKVSSTPATIKRDLAGFFAGL